MIDDTQSLLEDALALPAGQRADLVHDLLASLEPVATENPDQVAAAWSRELERRGHATLNGTAPGTEWATVRDRLRDELIGERFDASRSTRTRRPSCARPPFETVDAVLARVTH